MLATLTRQGACSSQNKRLAVSVAFSIAVHIGILQIPFRIPGLAVALPHLNVVALPAKAHPDEHPSIPLPTENPLLAGKGTGTSRHKIVELNPLPAEVKTGSFDPLIYFPAKELTRKPMVQSDWDSLGWRLPPQAKGVVIVTAYISVTGNVDRLEFPSAVSSEMQEWVRDTLFAGTTFSPGERNGIPVPTRYTLEFELTSIRR